MTPQRNPQPQPGRSGQAGFGMIEVLIAMVVVMVGLLGMLTLFSQAVATTQLSQLDLIARQKAREALESIYTARNTQQITFDQIRNVSQGGIFLDGFQPLRQPNPDAGSGDGLVGTADDGSIEKIVLRGPDGYRGTGDDKIWILEQFERKIELTDINENLRRIDIEIRFRTPWGTERNFQIDSFISSYR